MSKQIFNITPVSGSIPYDDQNVPTNLGDNVQEAIDTLYNQMNSITGASPKLRFVEYTDIGGGIFTYKDSTLLYVPNSSTGEIQFLIEEIS